jgi:hypothetical protein
MSAFYDLSKTPRNILNQAIVRAIVSENNGALFDPSDMTTLFQDAAGTIPVTAVEQPIGKILDKSGNGYHATQSITASRPVLSARYNLGLNTSQVMTGYAGWSGGAVGTINSALAPDGTMTASTVTTQEWMWREGFGGAYGSCSFAIYARAPSGTSFQTSITIWNEGTSTKIASKIITVTDVWERFTLSGITTAGVSLCRVSISNAGGGVNPPVGSMWWGYDVRVGADMGPYQRVNTATDYDTDERYFHKYLKFDGVDDYLNLPYMGLYANGSASVVAATTVKPSTWSTILAEGYGGMGGLYILARYTGTNKLGTLIQDDNVNKLRELETPITRGITTVFSVVDAGSAITHWVSSMLAGSSNYTRSGTLTSAVTLVGARPYVDTLNGNLYGLIITKSALTDAQRIACERHVARKAGVIL